MSNVSTTTSTPDFDPDALREKYRLERDKRIRRRLDVLPGEKEIAERVRLLKVAAVAGMSKREPLA